MERKYITQLTALGYDADTDKHYLGVLAGVDGLDSIMPGFELQRVARELATGVKDLEAVKSKLVAENLSNEDIACAVLMSVMYTLSQKKEENPVMVDAKSPYPQEVWLPHGLEESHSISDRDLRLSNGTKLKIVTREMLGWDKSGQYNHHEFSWRLATVSRGRNSGEERFIVSYKTQFSGTGN